MRLTHRERVELSALRHKFAAADVRQVLSEFTRGLADIESGESAGVYRALRGIEKVKLKFQEMHNYNHTVGMIAAKLFLEGEFPELEWERIEFASGVNKPGHDIYIVNPHVQIVGELKTTEPCGYTQLGLARRFGGNQAKNIEKDLQKLAGFKYQTFSRYMFVTSRWAYDCLVRAYRNDFPEICFVLLSEPLEVSRPASASG